MLKVPIFYYHSIADNSPASLSISDFKSHLTLIREMEFKPITFSELLSLQPDDHDPYVVLSFDDGLLDNFENAVPILDEFGFRATFFVIPGFDDIIRWVNPKTKAWSDYECPGYTLSFPAMQNHHRQQLCSSGMEIGCHSMTHPKLNRLSAERLKTEIVDSKTLLEDQLGSKVTTFCYPKGRYDQAVLNQIRDAGYRGACTTMPGYYTGLNPKFECGRFLIEPPWLFKNILRWTLPSHVWTDPLCDLLRLPLKIKNKYF